MSIYKYYVQVGHFFFGFIGSHHTFLYLFASYNLVKMEKKQNILSLQYWDPGWLHAKKKKIYTITKRCLKITHNLVKLHHLDIFSHQWINYTYCKISLQTRRTNNVALIFCFQRKKYEIFFGVLLICDQNYTYKFEVNRNLWKFSVFLFLKR